MRTDYSRNPNEEQIDEFDEERLRAMFLSEIKAANLGIDDIDSALARHNLSRGRDAKRKLYQRLRYICRKVSIYFFTKKGPSIVKKNKKKSKI